jgi:hypothetical protein
MSEKDFQVQADIWISGARSVAMALPSLDFLGWNREHYVILRSEQQGNREIDEARYETSYPYSEQ